MSAPIDKNTPINRPNEDLSNSKRKADSRNNPEEKTAKLVKTILQTSQEATQKKDPEKEIFFICEDIPANLVLDDIQNQLKINFESRLAHTSELTVDEIDKLSEIENALNALETLIFEHGSLSLREKSKIFKPYAKQITELLKNNLNLSQTESDFLLDPYTHLNPSLSTSIDYPEPPSLLLNYYKERMLSKCTNNLLYKNKIAKILTNNKQKIVQNLLTNKAPLEETIHFQTEPTKGETHNKGEITYKITIFQGETVIKQLLYHKARDGLAERAVLNLFHQLNEAWQKENLYEGTFLIYKILDLGSEGSLWEAVEGTHPQGSVVHAIQNMKNNNTTQNYKKNLLRLNTVCLEAGIYDLHHENILLTPEGKIVPIDCECIDSQPVKKTHLITPEDLSVFTNWQREFPNFCTLTDHERKLIQEFRTTCHKTTITRIVPVATGDWGKLGCIRNPTKMQELTKNLKDALSEIAKRERKTMISFNLRRALKWVLEDTVNGDIPYCTRMDDTVYWGRTKLDENVICSFKKELT